MREKEGYLLTLIFLRGYRQPPSTIVSHNSSECPMIIAQRTLSGLSVGKFLFWQEMHYPGLLLGVGGLCFTAYFISINSENYSPENQRELGVSGAAHLWIPFGRFWWPYHPLWHRFRRLSCHHQRKPRYLQWFTPMINRVNSFIKKLNLKKYSGHYFRIAWKTSASFSCLGVFRQPYLGYNLDYVSKFLRHIQLKNLGLFRQ